MPKQFLLFVLLALTCVIYADECTFSAKAWVLPSRVLSCMRQMPFREDIRRSVLDTLDFVYPAYAFRDIIRNSALSGSKYNVTSTVEESLQAIRSMSFNYDYEFHVQVGKVIASAKDPHLAYAVPCYNTFAFYHPFRLGPVRNANGVIDIIVKSVRSDQTSVVSGYSNLYGVDVSRYYGYKVQSINGRDPMSVLIEFADQVGSFSYDLQTRFNQILKTDWYVRNLMQKGFPSVISYVLVSPAGAQVTVNIDWVATSLADITNTVWLKSACGYTSNKRKSTTSSSTSSSSTTSTRVLDELKDSYDSIPQDMDREVKNLLFFKPLPSASAKVSGAVYKDLNSMLFNGMHSWQAAASEAESEEEVKEYQYWSTVHSNLALWNQVAEQYLFKSVSRTAAEAAETEAAKKRSTEQSSNIINYYNGNEYSLYIFKQTTLVLRLKTFLFADLSSFVKSFQDNIEAIALRYNSIKNVIVDVRANTGGYVDMAFKLARWLVPTLPLVSWPLIDVPYSSFSDQIFGCSVSQAFLPTYDPHSGKLIPNGNTTWYTTSISRTRGGKTSKYSSLVHLQESKFMNNFTLANPWYSFGLSNLTILTDGDCGSACGMFLTFLQHTENAKVVSVAGIPGHDSAAMGLASFYGAPVQQLQNVQATMNTMSILGGCSMKIPGALPMKGRFTTSLLEMYPWLPKIAAYEKLKTDVSLPLAFTFVKADFHVSGYWPLDELDSQDAVYDGVVQYFGMCVPGKEYKQSFSCGSTSTVTNGIYGSACINSTAGTFDSSCILFSCAPGFYLSEDKTQCFARAIPDPTDPTVFEALLNRLATIIIIVLVSICCCACCCFIACGVCIAIVCVKVLSPGRNNNRELKASMLANDSQLSYPQPVQPQTYYYANQQQ